MRVAVPFEQCWADVPGGTARTIIDLGSALDARDDVDVVGVSARHRHPPAPDWDPGLPVHPLPLPRWLLHEAWHGIRWPDVEFATGRVDLCHAVGGAVPGSRSPLVVTVHDLAFSRFPEMFSAQGRRFLGRALELTRAHAAQVQVPSRATLEDCVAHGIDPAKLRHVPWGCTVGDPSAGAVAAVRDRFHLPERYVVFVGTQEPRKNLAGLLHAWRRLNRDDVGLVLVGPAGWGGEPEGSTSAPNVTTTGFVDAETRDALYRGAVASCYPSLFEGFGLPVLESMALGCPVVTSAGTATEELVAGGAGVAVEPTDVDALADALGRLLDDDARRSALRTAGLARAAQYRWDQTAELVVTCYREVLG